jgi:pyridoxal phosphate enzyme (YggS family)
MSENQGTVQRYQDVMANIALAAQDAGRDPASVQLVAVSKTFDAPDILPVIEAGQRVFGENRVQESQKKWPELKARFPDLELHLIGPLQSNKAREALDLFDVIETLDRESVICAIAKEWGSLSKHPRLLVQVNTGAEPQKAGVLPNDLASILTLCAELGLPISGLMCIPPVDEPPSPHFAMLARLAKTHGLPHLSMGMSADYGEAIQLGADYVRVGSAIFGHR